MNWRACIEQLYAATPQRADESPRFSPPASQEQIAQMEQRFSLPLPDALKAILLETNGVMEKLRVGEEVIETGWLLWPVEEIIQENSWLRDDNQRNPLYAPFDDLLFFATPGVDGIRFAWRDSAPDSTGVYAWFPIEDERRYLAPSIEAFLTGWIGCTLSI